MLDIKIGCDPELVLFDKLADKFVPAIGLVEGTKDKPYMFPNGGMMQLDGLALEFGTPAVKPEGDNFSKALRETLDYVRQYLLDKHGDRYDLYCGSIADFGDTISPNHPALEVGCDPQYHLSSVYDRDLQVIEVNGRNNPRQIPLGGHIHFGFGKDIAPQLAKDTANSILYHSYMANYRGGTASVCGRRRMTVMNMSNKNPVRIKSYGVEWRKPSSLWLACPTYANSVSEVYRRTVSCLSANYAEYPYGLTATVQRELDDLDSNRLHKLVY